MRLFISLIKSTTIGRGAIISGFALVVFCQKPNLTQAFLDSSRNPALPHSWQANRRYYLLVQFLQKKGFKRCVGFLKERGCENLPRVREIQLLGKVQSPKRGLIGRLLIAEANLKNPYLFYDFTGEKGVLSAQQMDKLFSCFDKKKLPLEKIPNFIFYEGDGFLSYIEQNFSKKTTYEQIEKNLCKENVF